ncbi:hypothetical protein Ga0100230_006465 [Opitutaceae bacterium TAV3]|nr:hypothetical protein Ga0100230_006465 [Opitutaceae bacterium TAV3]
MRSTAHPEGAAAPRLAGQETRPPKNASSVVEDISLLPPPPPSSTHRTKLHFSFWQPRQRPAA